MRRSPEPGGGVASGAWAMGRRPADVMRWRRKSAGNPSFGRDSERVIQRGRFVCPREGVERGWRVVAVHRSKAVINPFSLIPFERRSAPYASVLVCDGCGRRFDLDAGRPMGRAERAELFRAGLEMTLAGLAHERVDDPPSRTAAVTGACAAAGLASLPAFDAASFEALVRKLDARLLPDQRFELVRIACDVGRSGRVKPYASPVLQILGGALGYSVAEITSRLTA